MVEELACVKCLHLTTTGGDLF